MSIESELEQGIADLVRNVVRFAPREPRISPRTLDFLAKVYGIANEGAPAGGQLPNGSHASGGAALRALGPSASDQHQPAKEVVQNSGSLRSGNSEARPQPSGSPAGADARLPDVDWV